MTGQEPNIDLGEEVESAPPRSVLFAVRMPPALAERVQSHAAARGISVSDVLRQGAEQVVSSLASTGIADAATYDAPFLLGADTGAFELHPGRASGDVIAYTCAGLSLGPFRPSAATPM